jgi:hypothetical protein
MFLEKLECFLGHMGIVNVSLRKLGQALGRLDSQSEGEK